MESPIKNKSQILFSCYKSSLELAEGGGGDGGVKSLTGKVKRVDEESPRTISRSSSITCVYIEVAVPIKISASAQMACSIKASKTFGSGSFSDRGSVGP